MSLLRKEQSAGTIYFEMAQFIRAQGDAEHAGTDLAQLFRRVAFNVAIGNRKDHLPNHGFVLCKTGWRLAPAFDVNPNIDKAEHVLNIDDMDNRPSLAPCWPALSSMVCRERALLKSSKGSSGCGLDGWQDLLK